MPSPGFAADLERHRAYLLRVARLQLRDDAQAEDVVQETLLAALSGSGFSGKSSLKTWLTGILKHKIVDAIRRKQREPVAVSGFGDLDDELDIEDFDAMFDRTGHWSPAPARVGQSGGTRSKAVNSSRSWTSASRSCRRTRPGCS